MFPRRAIKNFSDKGKSNFEFIIERQRPNFLKRIPISSNLIKIIRNFAFGKSIIKGKRGSAKLAEVIRDGLILKFLIIIKSLNVLNN